ncbi:MAG TPA: hypothetical protein VF472_07215 [Burkholderiaceae bacterium]
MKNFKDRLAEGILALAFLLIVLFLVIGVSATMNKFGIGSAETASWTQNVETFLAILAGGFFVGLQILEVRKQSHLALQRQDEVKNNLREGIRQTALQAQRLAESITSGELAKQLILLDISNAQRATFNGLIIGDANEIHSILANVSLDRLAELGLVEPVLYLRQALTRLAQHTPQFHLDAHWRPENASLSEMRSIQNLINRSLEETGPTGTKTPDYAKGERP